MRRRYQHWIARPWLVTIVVLLIAVVSAAGLCLHDAHAGSEHCGSPALHLCIGMLGVSLVSAPLLMLAVVGRAVAPAYLAVAFAALEVLELPPKL